MRSVEVLVIQPVSDDAMARIAAIDARFHWIDARYVFKGDYVETWFELSTNIQGGNHLEVRSIYEYYGYHLGANL